jgi:hypothetical protein
MGIQQTLIRSLGDEEAPPPPILGIVLTSGLYPVNSEGDAVNLGVALGTGGINLYSFFQGDEQLNMGVALPVAPLLQSTLVFTNYTNWPVEAVDLGVALPSAPVLASTIAFTNYTNWPVEAVDFGVAVAPGTSIVLTTTIQFVNYINWPIEAVDLSVSIQGATLA